MTRWTTKTLGDVTTIINGGTPKSGVVEYWAGEVLWITPKDMGKLDSAYVSDTSRKISVKGLAKSSAKLIPENSVILSTRAPIGHLAINTLPMATNQGCRGLVPLDALDTKYLFYFLRLNVDLLNDLGSGTTFKELSKGALSGIQIPLPPLPEQKRIVAILDKAFAGINAAVANTEKNLANARELFESYLNAVFTRKGEGWVEKPLQEVLLVQPRNGWSPPAKNHSDSGDPVLTLSSVTGFHFDGGKRKFTNAQTKEGAHYWLNDGELLITRSNTHELVGHVAICSNLSEPTICCDLIMKMQVDGKQANTKFVYWNLRCPKLRELITISAHGANPTMKKINKSDVQNLPLSLPAVSEQQTIADQLDSLANELKLVEVNYRQKLTALAELKQSILQKAFAGELTALPETTLEEAVA